MGGFSEHTSFKPCSIFACPPCHCQCHCQFHFYNYLALTLQICKKFVSSIHLSLIRRTSPDDSVEISHLQQARRRVMRRLTLGQKTETAAAVAVVYITMVRSRPLPALLPRFCIHVNQTLLHAIHRYKYRGIPSFLFVNFGFFNFVSRVMECRTSACRCFTFTTR